MSPRVLTVQDVNMLCNFAELAVRELERQQMVSAYCRVFRVSQWMLGSCTVPA